LTGEVLYISGAIICNGGNSSYFTGKGVNGIFDPNDQQKIQIVGPNCTKRNVSEADDLIFTGWEGGPGMGYLTISHLKNKKLWMCSSYYDTLSLVIDTEFTENWCRFPTITSSSFWAKAIQINHDTIIFNLYDITNNQYTNSWYYYKFDWDLVLNDPDFYLGTKHGVSINIEDILTAEALLFDNVQGGWPWVRTTLEGQVEYTVAFKDVNGERIPYGVKVSEYVAEEQQVVTLKPINR
jgi:hypothetical protein